MTTPLPLTDWNAASAAADSSEAGAAASAAAALASELAAGASASAAAAGAGAAIWVSGTTYAIGDVRWSPVTRYVYRRITAGAGTTAALISPDRNLTRQVTAALEFQV